MVVTTVGPPSNLGGGGSARAVLLLVSQHNTQKKLKFELEWGGGTPLLESGGCCALGFPRSQLCEAGQVETDKWPLEVVRPRGQAKSVPRVRRGRKSFDSKTQIAKLQEKFGNFDFSNFSLQFFYSKNL